MVTQMMNDKARNDKIEKFLQNIKACLENHYNVKQNNKVVYVSDVDMNRKRGAPLWMNMKIRNEFLACDVSNTPRKEKRFLTVSFFWRNEDCEIVNNPSHARSVGPLFWDNINCQWPKGYLTVKYNNHGGFRLQKVYDITYYQPADVTHEIERVYSLLNF